MIHQGTISDLRTGKPIPGASVRFMYPNGGLLREIVVSSTGHWQIDDETDGGLLDPGNQITFMAPHYYPYGISAETLPASYDVQLEVQPDKVLWIAGGAAAGALLLALSKPGKKMIGAAETESKKQGLPPWVLPIALVGGGVAAVLWYLNKKDPKEKDSGQLATDAQNKLNDLASQGQVTMLSDAELEGIASTIVEATDDCGTDENAIYNAFRQLYSEADFWALVKKFNVRQIKSCFGGNYGTNTPYNLMQIINEELSGGEKAQLNSILFTHGISYQFT